MSELSQFETAAERRKTFWEKGNQDNKNLCLVAISNNCYALGFASTRLQDDKDVCLAAVLKNGYALKHASTRLQDDKDVCLAAVSQNGHALEFASVRLRDDKEVCLAAVSQNGHALEHVSARLQDDKDVCLAAISSKPDIFGCVPNSGYVSTRLRNNKKFCLDAIQKNPTILHNISRNIPGDTRSIESFGGKYFSASTKKVITIHNQTTTTLFRLCMQNCKKSVYGFPEEIQDMVLSHVGSLDPGFKNRKDRIGEKRRINFMDDEFDGEIFSITKCE